MSIKSKLSDLSRTASQSAGAKLRPLGLNIWLMAVIVVLLAASQLTLFFSPITGVYVNALVFAVLVGLGLWHEKGRPLAISAAILPVATMLSLSLPQTTYFAQAVVFYDAILILALIYRFAFTLDYPLQNTQLTWRGYALVLPLMVVTGEALGVIGYGLLRHQYGYGSTSLPLVAATAVVFAIAEETLFRGLIQQRSSLILNPKTAAIMSAIVYALFTFGHTGSWMSPFFGLMLGAVLSLVYYHKQNLILTITVNAATKLVYVGLMASFIFR